MAYKEKRYCAFCKNLRTYYLKKHLSSFDIFLASVASLALMLLIWQDVDIKAFYFFVFAVIVAESLVLLRWRMHMNCDICGFDLILYKKDSKRAAEKVKTHMAIRRDDPNMLLKPYPKLTPLKKRKMALPLSPMKSGANLTNALKKTSEKTQAPASPQI